MPGAITETLGTSVECGEGATVQANLAAVVKAYGSLDSRTSISPSIFVIEPTNVCNFKCIMCPSDRISHKGFMELSVFERIVAKIRPSAKTVLLYLAGESLLHPNIIEMIRLLKDRTEAYVILSTNGSMLGEEMSRELVESGLDELIVGVDGFTPETYASIRIGGDLENLKGNISGFLRARGPRPRPRVVVQFIRMRENEQEVQGFFDEWSQKGCDVSVNWLDTWAGQMRSLVSQVAFHNPANQFDRTPCADLWYKMAINWEGKVVLCCHDFSALGVIGDLTRQSVSEVWNGDAVQQLRRAHAKRDYQRTSLCRGCREWSTDQDEFAYFEEVRKLGQNRP
jgi:radical SAM protein with 4Fe4S-binding SPASM domain